MRKLLPFALLIPPIYLVGSVLAIPFGIPLAYGTPIPTLLSAAAWTLMFLIFYGHDHSWGSVKLFLLIFVVYYQLYFDYRLDHLLLSLAGAAMISFILFAIFWREPRRKRKNSRVPTP